MQAAGSLLSPENTAGKMGFLAVKLELGCSGCIENHVRMVPGQDLWGRGSLLAVWGKKMEFELVNGNGFG